jgi:hypothetical protein
VNYSLLASQLIRVLRGRRSQVALSRRLGYRSNVLYSWESGDGFPSAAKFFRFVAQVGGKPAESLRRFLQDPELLQQVDLTTREGIAAVLRDLRGKRALGDLSEAIGRDRFAVSRWIHGKTEPPLPEFLCFVEATTLALVDFLATLVDPAEIQEVADRWRALQAARRSAYELPWSHAVLRAVDLQSYRELPEHRPGWIASQLGMSANEEQRCIELLCATGDLLWDGKRYRSVESLTVDTGRDPAATRHLAAFWMQQGAERVRAGADGAFAFNVFGVSRQDLERLRELQRGYFAELRSIIARSEPTECVAVATFQLFPLIGPR